MKLKEELYKQCVAFVTKKQNTIEATIASHQKSLESETKSSAGDKHETGRAMLQLEMEKASQQLIVAQQMKETLHKINLSESKTKVRLGSLVVTNNATYFMSISVGRLIVDSKEYFAISIASPIGKILLGQQVDSELVFNGNKILIKEIT